MDRTRCFACHPHTNPFNTPPAPNHPVIKGCTALADLSHHSPHTSHAGQAHKHTRRDSKKTCTRTSSVTFARAFSDASRTSFDTLHPHEKHRCTALTMRMLPKPQPPVPHMKPAPPVPKPPPTLVEGPSPRCPPHWGSGSTHCHEWLWRSQVPAVVHVARHPTRKACHVHTRCRLFVVHIKHCHDP